MTIPPSEHASATPEITFRSARATDYEALVPMYIDLSRSPERFADPANNSFMTILDSPTAHLIVAEQGQALTGFMSYSLRRVVRYRKLLFAIEELYVAPQWRRLGIARRFIELAIQTARAQDCAFVELQSGNELSEAHAFYRSQGFESTALYFRYHLA